MKKKLIPLITVFCAVLIIITKAFAVNPDIKADGASGTVSTSSGSVMLTVSLNAGTSAGQNADWWLAYEDSSGNWWYYNVFTSLWLFYDRFSFRSYVTHQGTLSNLGFTNINVSGLSTGAYTFYFGVDTVMNGKLDTSPGLLFYDSVAVNVTPGSIQKIPDTGQTKSYTNTFGEDSDYTINPPSYSDNGDGTVTDNVTGLIWQQRNAYKTYNWHQATGTADSWNNPGGAINVCGALTLAGYYDWRLPTTLELMSIVNYGTFNPAISSTYFPSTNLYFYWALSTQRFFSVNFTNGATMTPSSSGDYYFVRCVRGGKGAIPKNLTDNGDETVTDNNTGLIWQQGEGGQMNWQSALSYCENISLAGYSDWRLPNVKELYSLVDASRTDPAIDLIFFPGTPAQTGKYFFTDYWSSTTSVGNTTMAWFVDFKRGQFSYYNKPSTYFVRCVRGGR